MTGDPIPRPGISIFQRTFSDSPHRSGGVAVSEAPVAAGPRHWPHCRSGSASCATAAAGRIRLPAPSNPTAARRKAVDVKRCIADIVICHRRVCIVPIWTVPVTDRARRPFTSNECGLGEDAVSALGDGHIACRKGGARRPANSPQDGRRYVERGSPCGSERYSREMCTQLIIETNGSSRPVNREVLLL